MKQFAAMLIGFSLTLTIFAGGALTAVFFVNADPVHKVDMSAGSLWTSKAVRIRTATKDLERLPARAMLQQVGTEPQPLQGPPPASRPQLIDSGVTASFSKQDATYPSITAHTEWCSQRYRSYDPADDSYNAYSGARRKCISPYSQGDEPEIVNASADSSAALITATSFDEMSGALNSQHVQSCFNRYQSYHPDDNTYQPYGGGPRQQCE